MKRLIRSFFKPVLQHHWAADLFFAVIRFICGFSLAIYFGASKFGMPWTDPGQHLKLFEVSAWFPDDVASYGGIFAIAPAVFAWMGAFSEAVGGIFLALGLKTRLAAFLILCTMLVAIFCQQLDRGLYAALPAAGFLWVSAYNLVLGSGRFGVDYIISKKWKYVQAQ